MTINSNFDFNIETLKRDCPNVFDCKNYDTILYAAKILFGDKNVTYNEKTIFIKDKVCIELSLSWNEQKAYIYTYFDTQVCEKLKKVCPDRWGRVQIFIKEIFLVQYN